MSNTSIIDKMKIFKKKMETFNDNFNKDNDKIKDANVKI